jgi:hypothetical protein
LDFGTAFTNAGFTNAAGYGVDVVDINLPDIILMGHAHPLDFLVLATHGMVAQLMTATGPSGPPFDAMMSTSSVSDPTIAQGYAQDIAAHNLLPAVYLTTSSSGGSLPTYAFTHTFLTEHLVFNPNALFYNGSCLGANSLTLQSTTTLLQSAGVGRYLAWDKSVGIRDLEQTLAFMIDRILGEQSPSVTGLDQFVPQQTPPQRPFHLDDVQTAMQSEDRNGPAYPSENDAECAPPPTTYTESNVCYAPNSLAPPTGTLQATLQLTDLGAEQASNPPIVYLMPSITTMSVAESATNGILTINGDFPYVPGGVVITDSAGAHLMTPSNWTAHQVTVTIPSSGAGSAGNVQVLATDALPSIASNQAPLTQWTGTLTYQENDTVSSMGGSDGTGGGSLTAQFNITFRSDVHPFEAEIDSAAEPQNLYFGNVEGNSTAAVTALEGSFTSAEATSPPPTATLSLPSSASMTPHALPLSAGYFIVGAFPGQPSPCNNGSPGPEGNQGNVFCPGFGYFGPEVAECVADPSDSGLCGDEGALFSPAGSFGASSLLDPGLVVFTMDPATYAITVTSAQTDFTRTFRGDAWPAQATVTGSINAPSYAPTTATPALRHRPL